ncbi:expressed unknown protein [Seminavis robusta]|uniref:Uncharacterized protein n=1 Tax=Seminavis robusta TaxID=568900 RepID=A0A9N8H3G5_9STRA|nr:expressed unknown protein [Seminavis robusta]|eukprot:Sro38_g023911.1  (110) ;mRNA; f:151219-151548
MASNSVFPISLGTKLTRWTRLPMVSLRFLACRVGVRPNRPYCHHHFGAPTDTCSCFGKGDAKGQQPQDRSQEDLILGKPVTEGAKGKRAVVWWLLGRLDGVSYVVTRRD